MIINFDEFLKQNEYRISLLAQRFENYKIDGISVGFLGARNRILSWIDNFNRIGFEDFEIVLKLLERIEFVSSTEIVNRLGNKSKTLISDENAYIAPLGETSESSFRISSTFNQSPRYFTSLPELLDALPIHNNNKIILFDDFLNSGGQIISIFKSMLGLSFNKDEINDESEKRTLLNYIQKQKLLKADIHLFFYKVFDKGLESIEDKNKSGLGLKIKIHRYSVANEIDGAFGNQEDQAHIEYGVLGVINTNCSFLGMEFNALTNLYKCLQLVGFKLLQTNEPNWTSDKYENRKLGYGNDCRLIISEFNVPTNTITALWLSGKIELSNKIVQWSELFPRRKKILANKSKSLFANKHIDNSSNIKDVKELTLIPKINIKNVVGRQTILKKIYNALTASNNVLLLNGIGGIGKSTVAKLFVNQNFEFFNHIIWIDISSNFENNYSDVEKRNQFFEAFTNNPVLLSNFRISWDKSLSLKSRFEVLMNRIQNIDGQNLLVIDNATDFVEAMAEILPGGLNWKMIVTSREGMQGFKKISIDSLNFKEAMRLFYKHYLFEIDNVYAHEILKKIDFHTLSIEVLAKCANELRISLKSFYNILVNEGIHNAASQNIKSVYSQNFQLTQGFEILCTAFKLTNLNEFESDILMCFSVLPVIPIIEETIFKLLKTNGKEISDFKAALKELNRKGWLNSNDTNSEYIIHSVIQDVIKFWKKPKLKSLEFLIDNLYGLLSYDSHYDYVYKLKYLIYSKSIFENINEPDIKLIRLLNNTAVINEGTGDYYLSLEYLNRAEKHSLTKKNFDKELKLEILSNFGWVLHLIGNHEEAEHRYLAAVDLAVEIGNVYKLGSTYNDIGWFYRTAKQLDKAKFFLEKAHVIADEIFNPDSIEKAEANNNIGIVLAELGDFDESTSLLQQSLNVKKVLLGENSLKVAISYSNLSHAYRLKGDLDKALLYIRKCIEIEDGIFEGNHQLTSLRYFHLGLILEGLQRLNESLNAFKASLTAGRIYLPSGHFLIREILEKIDDIKLKLGA